MAHTKIHVRTPRVPNFLQLGTGHWIPLCDLRPEELNELAKDWTAALHRRADEQSKDPEAFRKRAGNGEGV